MKRKTNPLTDLTAYRKSRGESQAEFWSRFGLSQSTGSKYESGRAVPTPVAMLMLAFYDDLLDEAALVVLAKRVGKATADGP